MWWQVAFGHHFPSGNLEAIMVGHRLMLMGRRLRFTGHRRLRFTGDRRLGFTGRPWFGLAGSRRLWLTCRCAG